MMMKTESMKKSLVMEIRTFCMAAIKQGAYQSGLDTGLISGIWHGAV
jgi:hypothetical protein